LLDELDAKAPNGIPKSNRENVIQLPSPPAHQP
jgi:hypothetical protein